MSLKPIFNVMAISGIVTKSDEELDVLPPPPKFPEIINEDLKALEVVKTRNQEEKETERERKEQEKERKRQIRLRKREEEKIRKQEEKQRIKEEELERKRIFEEKLRRDKLREEKKSKIRKNIFEFFHNIGLVKTEEEKREIESKKHREEKLRKKELEWKEKEIRKQKLRIQRQKKQERKRQEKEGRRRIKLQAEREKELEKERIRELREEEKRELERIKAEERTKGEEEKKKLEVEKQKKIEAEKQKQTELESKRKEDLEKKNKDLMQKRGEKLKEKSFDFFNKTGFVKTEQEKKEFEGQRVEYKKRREMFKKIPWIEEKEAEKTKAKERVQSEIQLGFKKSNLKGLISRKQEEKEVVKPKDVTKAGEEINKAIDDIKGPKKKKPAIGGLFKKKKEMVEEKLEIPGIMPRTYDKIDHIELIEEQMHKARLALMDFRFDDAKKVYIQIMKMYNELDPKNKSRVYQDIKDLYYERKSAEKFAK